MRGGALLLLALASVLVGAVEDEYNMLGGVTAPLFQDDQAEQQHMLKYDNAINDVINRFVFHDIQSSST